MRVRSDVPPVRGDAGTCSESVLPGKRASNVRGGAVPGHPPERTCPGRRKCPGRAEPLGTHARLGYGCAEADDPYAAMAELCRRPMVYRAVILSLSSLHREEDPGIHPGRKAAVPSRGHLAHAYRRPAGARGRDAARCRRAAVGRGTAPRRRLGMGDAFCRCPTPPCRRSRRMARRTRHLRRLRENESRPAAARLTTPGCRASRCSVPTSCALLQEQPAPAGGGGPASGTRSHRWSRLQPGAVLADRRRRSATCRRRSRRPRRAQVTSVATVFDGIAELSCQPVHDGHGGGRADRAAAGGGGTGAGELARARRAAHPVRPPDAGDAQPQDDAVRLRRLRGHPGQPRRDPADLRRAAPAARGAAAGRGRRRAAPLEPAAAPGWRRTRSRRCRWRTCCWTPAPAPARRRRGRGARRSTRTWPRGWACRSAGRRPSRPPRPRRARPCWPKSVAATARTPARCT